MYLHLLPLDTCPLHLPHLAGLHVTLAVGYLLLLVGFTRYGVTHVGITVTFGFGWMDLPRLDVCAHGCPIAITFLIDLEPVAPTQITVVIG